VVNWARTHLHVLQYPASWTVAGYSSGGECAVSFGAKYPGIWGNVLDVSGESYPGWGTRSQVAATVFHGNWSAYSETWPVNLLAGHKYSNLIGIFTVGSDDDTYRPQAIQISNAAKNAGWKTTYVEVPNGGHGEAALIGGLQDGYNVLYPRLGLSAPTIHP
jgi:enterochelin esterase-like enzyme